MNIRIATISDIKILSAYDHHIKKTELESVIALGRVLIAENDGKMAGWLRWNLFWDNTPFMNMLYVLDKYRSCKIGSAMVRYWENLMRSEGYDMVMTSSLSNETAQHFYRKSGYTDAGALLLPGEASEIIFVKLLWERPRALKS